MSKKFSCTFMCFLVFWTAAQCDLDKPVCSTNGVDQVVCCTDCQLVNDISDAVVTQEGIFEKNGEKSRDYCLQLISQSCSSNIVRQFNSEKKCYTLIKEDNSSSKDVSEHPYQALIGHGENLESVKWYGSGAIISDRYILTSGFHSERRHGKLKYIALGVTNITGSRQDWKIYDVKNVIRYPSYEERPRNNDLALVETEQPIEFTANILPTCLPTNDVRDGDAYVTTWERKEFLPGQATGDIRIIKVQKFLKDECLATTNRYNLMRYNDTIHVCYGNRQDLWESSKVNSGDPLVIRNYLSSCLHTLIGLQSYWISGSSGVPTVYTRISSFLPWIESIVWA